MKWQFFTYFLLIAGLISCSEESNDKVVEMDLEFEVYVNRFVEEAAGRGIIIDFSDTGLRINFRKAVDTETGGVCRGHHQIEIEKFYWDDLTDLQKEGLIFHELGHCELMRAHRNDRLSNGEWASRMRGDPIPEGFSPTINYTGVRREYYVDELFNPSEPEPVWAGYTAKYNDIEPEKKEVQKSLEEAKSFEETLNMPSSADYEIEFTIDAGFSESWVGIQWAGNTFEDALRVVYDNKNRFIIDSGNKVYGILRDIYNMELLNNNENKITIRRIGDKYLIFLNEQFVYWFDYITPGGNTIKSFVAGHTYPLYTNITISKILH